MIIAVFDECSRRVDIDGKVDTMGLWTSTHRFVECRSKKNRYRYIFQIDVQNNAWIVLGTVEDGDIFVEIPNELLKKKWNNQCVCISDDSGRRKNNVRSSVGSQSKKKTTRLRSAR